MNVRIKGLALGLSLLAVTIVTDAGADERAAGSVSSAALSSLPTGRVPLPPRTKAPAAIPAAEKVAGFAFTGQRGRTDWVALASPKMAKQVSEGTRGQGSLVGETCFAEDAANRFGLRGFDDVDGERVETAWQANLQPILSLSTSTQHGQRPHVTAVHSERLAEDAGNLSLEVADAWVDPSTRGVRLIARSSVPLEPVSTLLGGTRVYAVREGQSIHVVLVAPKDQKRINGGEAIFAVADNSVFNSSCDHIRVTLKADKGQGQTTNIIANVELPSLQPKDVPEAGPELDIANARVAQRTHKEARIRPVHVHASMIWGSRDKEPVLSVSAGWDARERTVFVF